MTVLRPSKQDFSQWQRSTLLMQTATKLAQQYQLNHNFLFLFLGYHQYLKKTLLVAEQCSDVKVKEVKNFDSLLESLYDSVKLEIKEELKQPISSSSSRGSPGLSIDDKVGQFVASHQQELKALRQTWSIAALPNSIRIASQSTRFIHAVLGMRVEKISLLQAWLRQQKLEVNMFDKVKVIQDLWSQYQQQDKKSELRNFNLQALDTQFQAWLIDTKQQQCFIDAVWDINRVTDQVKAVFVVKIQLLIKMGTTRWLKALTQPLLRVSECTMEEKKLAKLQTGVYAWLGQIENEVANQAKQAVLQLQHFCKEYPQFWELFKKLIKGSSKNLKPLADCFYEKFGYQQQFDFFNVLKILLDVTPVVNKFIISEKESRKKIKQRAKEMANQASSLVPSNSLTGEQACEDQLIWATRYFKGDAQSLFLDSFEERGLYQSIDALQRHSEFSWYFVFFAKYNFTKGSSTHGEYTRKRVEIRKIIDATFGWLKRKQTDQRYSSGEFVSKRLGEARDFFKLLDGSGDSKVGQVKAAFYPAIDAFCNGKGGNPTALYATFAEKLFASNNEELIRSFAVFSQAVPSWQKQWLNYQLTSVFQLPFLNKQLKHAGRLASFIRWEKSSPWFVKFLTGAGKSEAFQAALAEGSFEAMEKYFQQNPTVAQALLPNLKSLQFLNSKVDRKFDRWFQDVHLAACVNCSKQVIAQAIVKELVKELIARVMKNIPSSGVVLRARSLLSDVVVLHEDFESSSSVRKREESFTGAFGKSIPPQQLLVTKQGGESLSFSKSGSTVKKIIVRVMKNIPSSGVVLRARSLWSDIVVLHEDFESSSSVPGVRKKEEPFTEALGKSTPPQQFLVTKQGGESPSFSKSGSTTAIGETKLKVRSGWTGWHIAAMVGCVLLGLAAIALMVTGVGALVGAGLGKLAVTGAAKVGVSAMAVKATSVGLSVLGTAGAAVGGYKTVRSAAAVRVYPAGFFKAGHEEHNASVFQEDTVPMVMG